MTATKAVEAPVVATGANNHISGLLSSDDIFGAEDTVYEYVDVRPYWQGTVKVKSLTAEERNKIGAVMRAESKKTNEDVEAGLFQTRVIIASLIDEDGKRVFSQSDAVRLHKKSGAAITRIFRACARISGIGDDAVEQAKDDLKNSPTDDSLGD